MLLYFSERAINLVHDLQIIPFTHTISFNGLVWVAPTMQNAKETMERTETDAANLIAAATVPDEDDLPSLDTLLKADNSVKTKLICKGEL